MRAAKERKRMAQARAPDTVEVGSVVFRGAVFGGEHVVRLLHRENEPVRLWLEIDGQPVMPRTVRGVRAVVARRIARAMRTENGTRNTEGRHG